MPVLKNRKHEAYAQGLAKALPQIEAYKAAGYKPDHGAASRLSSHANVKARVEELQAEAAKAVVEAVSYDALTQFNRIRKVADAALAAKDFRTAMDGEKFIAKCFGYEDSPTLTHEHVKGTSLKPAEQQAVQAEKPAAAAPTNRFGHIFEVIRKPTEKAN